MILPDGTSSEYVDIYNPSQNTIRPAPPLNYARHELASAVLGNKIYAIGGQNPPDGFLEHDAVEVYDPTHPELGWVIVDPLNVPRTKLMQSLVLVVIP